MPILATAPHVAQILDTYDIVIGFENSRSYEVSTMENRKQQILVTSTTHPNCSGFYNRNVLDPHWLDTYGNAIFCIWNIIGPY